MIKLVFYIRCVLYKSALLIYYSIQCCVLVLMVMKSMSLNTLARDFLLYRHFDDNALVRFENFENLTQLEYL